MSIPKYDLQHVVTDHKSHLNILLDPVSSNWGKPEPIQHKRDVHDFVCLLIRTSMFVNVVKLFINTTSINAMRPVSINAALTMFVVHTTINDRTTHNDITRTTTS